MNLNDFGPQIAGVTTPTLKLELEPLPNMLGIQGFNYDELTGEWFMNQALTESGVEHTYIHRFSAEGKFISTMKLTAAEHNTSVALRREGVPVYLWVDWPNKAKKISYQIAKVHYGRGTKTVDKDAQIVNVWEPAGRSKNPMLDNYNNMFGIRTITKGYEIFTRRHLSELEQGIDNIVNRVQLPHRQDVFQGSAMYGRNFYRVVGGASGGGYLAIKQYDFLDFKPLVKGHPAPMANLVAELDVSKWGLTGTETKTSWLEPEGLCVTHEGLFLGLKVHKGKARRFRIFKVADHLTPLPVIKATDVDTAAKTSSPSAELAKLGYTVVV